MSRRWRGSDAADHVAARRRRLRVPGHGVLRRIPGRHGLSGGQDPQPGDGEWSYSPYDYSDRLAGIAVWYYEHDGAAADAGRPQPGRTVCREDHQGTCRPARGADFRWNPRRGATENRTTITDPLTGKERPVIGTSVAYASAIGAGGWSLVLPQPVGKPLHAPEDSGQRRRVHRLLHQRRLVRADLSRQSTGPPVRGQRQEQRAQRRAAVELQPRDGSGDARRWRRTRGCATGSTRTFRQVPADMSSLPADAQGHVMWAADVWYSIKKRWCIEAQNLIRARRIALGRP